MYIYCTKKWNESDKKGEHLRVFCKDELTLRGMQYLTLCWEGKATVTHLVHHFRCFTFAQAQSVTCQERL